ncbi:mechanosensitive ion channel family protein [Pelagibacterium limicola]|uniref:mechanosensitive ion channel family protein n=1 Tax=Pelagibacterium limicola TaxID=2791022 RepID=UPI0018AF59DE|nr:mechanosensitive ion channel family protein [Pelagibacterium limicola]
MPHPVATLAIRPLPRLLALIFLVWVSLSAVFAQEGGPEITGDPETGQPAGIENGLQTDRENALEMRLTQILVSTGWFRDIEIDVQHGVVTIDGITDTAEHRAWASTLAERMEGTVAVVNRLAIGADFQTALERMGGELERLARRAEQTAPLAILAIAIAGATWLLSALVARGARRALAPRIHSPLLLGVVVRLISFPVLLLGIYFVLQVAGLTRLAVTVLGGTGIVGIIVGFAFRDIAENFLASLLLSVRNPFKTGDLIEVAGQTGVVQNLNTRSTVLLTLDGNHVQIPNATVFKSTITNFSSTPTRRAEFLVNIDQGASVAEAQAVVLAILREHPAVLEHPEPLVLVDNLGAANVVLRVSYWFDGRTYSPAKTNSALLRLTRNALLRPSPQSGQEARAAQPKVPNRDNPLPSPPPRPGSGATDAGEVTAGEGELTNEMREVETQVEGEIPEAAENLLKP